MEWTHISFLDLYLSVLLSGYALSSEKKNRDVINISKFTSDDTGEGILSDDTTDDFDNDCTRFCRRSVYF
jgi:hypothetical protein